MTDDPYADATGLVERSAAAYAEGVPERPADDGFFGPASVTWRAAGDLSAPVAGLRALLMQALHPLAMAGVDQHSDWREDPVGRLAATSAYLATVSFGEKAAAQRAAARVRRIHEYVRGVDPVTGRPYAARRSRPCCSGCTPRWWSRPSSARHWFGMPLEPADADRYVAEMVVAAELVGVPRDLVPASVAELDRIRRARCAPTWPARRPPASRWPTCSTRPGWATDLAEIWQDIRAGAIGSLPDWACELYGYRARADDRSAQERDPAGARRPRRGLHRRARRPGGEAADRGPGTRRSASMRRRAARASIAGAVALAGLAGRRRRGAAPPGRAVRLQRGAAALQLVARGGARYATSAPRLFAAAGDQRQQLRQDLALETARGCRPDPGGDEGRPDEDRPDGQLRRRRPVAERAADAQPAAGQRPADERRARRRASSRPSSGWRPSGRSRNGIPSRSRPRRSARCTGRSPMTARPSRSRCSTRASPRRSPPTWTTSRCCAGCCGSPRQPRTSTRCWPSSGSASWRSSTTGARRRTRRSSRSYYDGHPTISVPKVIGELSTRRMVTSELAVGARFAELAELAAGRARPGRRDDLPVRLPEPVRGARVQRRPASGQLPVPRRRPGHLPGLRAGQALHRRRAAPADADGAQPVRSERPRGVPALHGDRAASCAPARR